MAENRITPENIEDAINQLENIISRPLVYVQMTSDLQTELEMFGSGVLGGDYFITRNGFVYDRAGCRFDSFADATEEPWDDDSPELDRFLTGFRVT